MPSTTETGHAKNVANFETLISFCNGYGAAYNPTKSTLTVTSLADALANAKVSLQQAKTAKTSFDNATNTRQLAFKNLKPLATKVVNALAVSGTSTLAVADAKTINRKIQGVKASSTKPPTTPADPNAPTPTDKSISTSQQSYDSLIDHFTKLIEVVQQDANYQPNENDLKVATLQTNLSSLKTANTDLVNSFTDWSNARINRNNILYNPLTGLNQMASDVKKYVKSVFGATSPQYKQISSLLFSTVKDR